MRSLLSALAALATGFMTGAGVGYLLGLAANHFKDARTPEDFQMRAQALADKPREVADQLQARIEQAVEEGRQAAAQTRAELEAEASRRPAPAPAKPAA